MKEDADDFHKKLNNDIDEIIEEYEQEDTSFRNSHIFLTISIVCLIFAFGILKGFFIFGFVIGCFWFFNEEDIKPLDKTNMKKEEKLEKDSK